MNEVRPKPPVKKRCEICWDMDWRDSYQVIVSPSGNEHLGLDGKTACGHDATGEKWWWPA